MDAPRNELLVNQEYKILYKQVEKVNYPGLESSPFHGLAKRLFKGSGGGVLSFEVKGGPSAAQALLKVRQWEETSATACCLASTASSRNSKG